jgi:hypothetical protein
MSEVVWWTDGGKVLHRDPECPPMLRAIRRQLWNFTQGQYDGDTVHSYDFNDDGAGNAVYPPLRLQLCKLCDWPR